MSENITKFNLKPLGECVEVLDRLRKPLNSEERRICKGNIPYYGANGQLGTIDKWIFDEALVLVAEDGGFFEDSYKPISYRISGKAWVNNHAHVLRPNISMDVDWINFSICFQDIRHLIKGATLKKLNQSELKKILIPCPAIDEQRRIVLRIIECMERVEEIETLRKKQKNAIDLLQDTILDTLLDNDWPLRPLSDLLIDIRNGWSGKQSASAPGVGVLRLSCVHSKKIDFNDTKTVNIAPEVAKLFYLKKDDVFIVRGNGSPALVGRSAIAIEDCETVIFNDLLIRLRFSTDVLPSFVNYLFHTRKIRKQIFDVSHTAAGIWKINQKGISQLKIPCPDIDIQTTFVDKATAALENCEKLKQQTESSPIKSLRESILRKAFAGEL